MIKPPLLHLVLPVLLWVILSSLPASADEFVYVDETGTDVSITARLLGAGQGFQALERTDGQIRLVPTAAIRSRDNTGDPEPVNCEAMAERLKEIFTPELTRIEIQKSVVVAMVLAAPLDRPAESHASAFIRKAARFMNNVDGVFRKYAEFMHFPLRELKFPLVLVIFESDADFETYADEATGGRSLSASSITGFYSGLTNWLAVRMSACDSFEVPLHEAIHQQMYNRVLQRLAPIPKWFDEGIATGFEGNGERIDSNPAKVNSRYARLAIKLGPQVSWNSIIGNDASFSADVLAGDAYTLAWCLHWMLATQHRENYQKFVAHLSERPALSEKTSEDEAGSFSRIFGVDMNQLQAHFPQVLQQACKRQKVSLVDAPPGNSSSQQALGQYSIDAVSFSNLGGQLRVGGALRNISPLRPMTFYVTVETESGLYADWLVPDLKPTQKQALPTQIVTKQITRDSRGNSSQYRVFIRSVPASSPEAAAWKNGELPSPVTADR